MRKPCIFPGIGFVEGIRGLGLKLTGDAFDALHGECVYAWFRQNECLYVGHAKNGFHRLLTNTHHVVNVIDQVQFTDEFHVFFGGSSLLERELILEWHPKYNKVVPMLTVRKESLSERYFALAEDKLDFLHEKFNRLSIGTPYEIFRRSSTRSKRITTAFGHLLATLKTV